MITAPAERLYLHADPDMGISPETDRRVIARHVSRYGHALGLVDGRRGVWMDIACGSGYGTEILKHYADYVIGVDPSQEAIKYAERHHRLPSMRYLCLTARDVLSSYAARVCDVVISIETLEHMPQEDQGPFLSTLSSLVKQEGVMVVACPLGNGRNPNNPYHVHEPSLVELSDMLSADWWDVSITTERYNSTSGPATQAWAVCHEPK